MAVTLDSFHAILDRRWNDANTRLVLADWLDEFGTTEEDRLRARGYRELGLRRIRPYVHLKRMYDERMYDEQTTARWQFLNSQQPNDWIETNKNPLHHYVSAVIPDEIVVRRFGGGYCGRTRRELEDRWALWIGQYLTKLEETKS